MADIKSLYLSGDEIQQMTGWGDAMVEDYLALNRAVDAIVNPEPTRLIGATNQPVFENGWVNNGSPANPAGFYRDASGRGWLQGSVKSGTVPSAVFTLPTEYIPDEGSNYSQIDGTGTPSARIVVLGLSSGANAGEVQVLTGSNAQVGLDGISWRI